MRRSTSGFTIVELIIVVAVIGIIAAIAFVAYNGIQQRTLNTQRGSELLGWKTTFEKYKADNGEYPVMPNGGYCLGTDFPDGKCRNYNASSHVYYESNSTELMEALAPYDPPPIGTRVPVLNISVGPYVDYTSAHIDLITAMIGGNASDCPEGSSKSWAPEDDSRMTCRIRLSK